MKTINFLQIKQYTTTLRYARDAGLFTIDEHDDEDWIRRSHLRPEQQFFVYAYKGDVLGWIEGERADFETLQEWVENYSCNLLRAECRGATKSLRAALSRVIHWT